MYDLDKLRIMAFDQAGVNSDPLKAKAVFHTIRHTGGCGNGKKSRSNERNIKISRTLFCGNNRKGLCEISARFYEGNCLCYG